MLERLPRYRRMLKGLALGAVILLCGGQVLAGQHLHEASALEEICTVCGYSESGFAPVCDAVGGQAVTWASPDFAEAPAAPVVSRDFEILPPRAPPVS